MDAEQKKALNNARRIAKFLDTEFGIGRFKFGLDPILGLIPVVGDSLPLILSLYIVLTAFKFDISNFVIFRMLFNLLVDYVFGSIPLIGDIFDAAYKANVKNMKLLEKHVAA